MEQSFKEIWREIFNGITPNKQYGKLAANPDSKIRAYALSVSRSLVYKFIVDDNKF